MKFIINWFNRIFGRKTPKRKPEDPPLPVLSIFTIGQDKNWKNFLAPGNLND